MAENSDTGIIDLSLRVASLMQREAIAVGVSFESDDTKGNLNRMVLVMGLRCAESSGVDLRWVGRWAVVK